MYLAWMGDERLAPAPARVGAVAGLEADLDRSFRHVVAEAGPALGAARAGWLDPAHLAAEGRFDHDTRAVAERAHHLVAGNEWIAGQRVEIQRRVAADSRQVGAADPRQRGRHAHPVLSRQL